MLHYEIGEYSYKILILLTCKNIEKPAVCGIVLGCFDLKLRPEVTRRSEPINQSTITFARNAEFQKHIYVDLCSPRSIPQLTFSDPFAEQNIHSEIASSQTTARQGSEKPVRSQITNALGEMKPLTNHDSSSHLYLVVAIQP